ncbi:MAG: hypothetical protein JKY45_02455 [Emcibacter sp.]|nr:hypothetical protein [Emcibacter sp.]
MSGCSRGIGQKHPSSFVRIIKFITKSMLVAALCTVFGALAAHAGWVHFPAAKVVRVSTYVYYDHIIFSLENSPTVRPDSCPTAGDFAIDPAVPAEQRQQMLSVLLTAKMTGTPLYVSYEGSASCIDFSGTPSYLKVYRISM